MPLPALAARGSTTFDPLRDLPWWSAHWASDPLWTPPASGAACPSWRDGTGSGHPATGSGTAQPLFIASSINSKPALRFDGVDDVLATAAFAPTKSQTLTWLAIAKFTAAPTTTRKILGTGGSTSRGLGAQNSGGNWSFNLATALTGGTVNTAAHLIVGVGNSASSRIDIDGTTVATGDAGTGGLSFLSIGAGSSTGPSFAGYWAGDIAFAAVARGDVTTLAPWADFKAWVRSFYGLTIA